MAPEQIEQRLEAIGPPTDVYAIGAILYELLTGRPPHAGETVWELMRAVVTRPPTAPRRERPGVPADLDAITLKCLEKRPEQRYATASELAIDLERFLDRRPTRARPLGPLRRSARWASRHPAGSGVIALGILIAALSLGAAVVLGRANSEARLALDRERAYRYVASLASAQQMIRLGRFAQAQRLLGELAPPADASAPDPRDFAWYYLRRQSRRDRTILDDLFPSPGCGVVAGGDVLLGFSGRQRGSGVWHLDHPGGLGPYQLGATRPIPRFEQPPGFGPGPDIHGAVTRDGRLAALLSKRPDSDPVRLTLVDPVAGRILGTDDTTPFLHASPISFRPNQDVLAYGIKAEGRQLARRERTADGRLVPAIEVPWGWGVLFTGDGARVVSNDIPGPTDRHRQIHLSDVATGRLIMSTRPGEVFIPIAVSPADRGPIATTSPSGAIHLRDPGSGAVVATIPLPGGVDAPPTALAFAPDAPRLIAAHDRIVVLWDIDARRELARFEGVAGRIESAAFVPGWPGDVALGVGNGEVILWHTAEPVETSTLAIRHEDEAWDVAFLDGGRRLVSVGGDRLLRRLDLTTGRVLAPMAGHEDWPSCLTVDPSGRRLASADFTGRVLIWDEKAGRLDRSIRAHSGRIWTLAYSPDGRILASAGRDRSILLWDPSAWGPPAALRGHALDVRGVAFSPDGRTLASVGDDAAVVLWDVATLRERSRWTTPIDATCVAFSPDGRTLAVGDISGSITLRSSIDDSPRSYLPGLHGDEVRKLAFSPDGRVLAAAGQDGGVSLVDVRTGRAHLSLAGHEAGVNAVAFSPDGRTLASAGHDRSVRLWWAGPEMPAR
jgi:WD40 repeat protein